MIFGYLIQVLTFRKDSVRVPVLNLYIMPLRRNGALIDYVVWTTDEAPGEAITLCAQPLLQYPENSESPLGLGVRVLQHWLRYNRTLYLFDTVSDVGSFHFRIRPYGEVDSEEVARAHLFRREESSAFSVSAVDRLLPDYDDIEVTPVGDENPLEFLSRVMCRLLWQSDELAPLPAPSEGAAP